MSEPERTERATREALGNELPPSVEPLGVAPRLAVGCLTFVAGVFSGGMVFVLIGKLVGSITGCEPPPELPACHWHLYAGSGMLLGGVTLPILALRRLARIDPPPTTKP